MKYLVSVLYIVGSCALANIVCPDSHECLDGQTCCPLNSGGYGCCEFSDAVCCAEDLCCPAGKLCIRCLHLCVGAVAGTNGSQISITPSAPKTRALLPRMIKNIVCPGTRFSCPDKSTCCPTGCCLESNAVCCSDGKHCCPRGSICDVRRRKCVVKRWNETQVYKKKMIEIDVPDTLKLKTLYNISSKAEICPSRKYYCSGNHTCCPGTTASHCCPQGTTCGSDGKSCNHVSNLKRPKMKSLVEPVVIAFQP